MRALDIVRHRETGATGVVYDTFYLLREEGRLSIVYNASGAGEVIEDDRQGEFEVVGRYDAIPDPKRCGMGKGQQCCRFLGWTGVGATCSRFGSLHWAVVLQARELRDPGDNYPDCMLETQ